MNEVHILDIKLIGAGIVFIAFALIVVSGFALGPYLEVASPNDGKLLILASAISLGVMIAAYIPFGFSSKPTSTRKHAACHRFIEKPRLHQESTLDAH